MNSNNMIKIKLALIAIMSFCCFSSAIAQEEMTISGNVSDKTGFPIPGVSVIVKGTTKGVVTDFDGNYTLEGVEKGKILVFSYLGLQNQEIVVSNQSTINVTMQEESNELEQVVIIGYGSSSKKDLTSAISTISAAALEEQPVANLDQGIQGQVSGVTVTRSSGQPGGAVSVRIRGITSVTGTNEPLYIIDGVNVTSAGSESFQFSRFSGTGGQTTVSPLSALNPNDIESITVLKDASATAIYGSQASNGVILITTKRGKVGKAKISYEMYGGIQTPQRLYDLLDLQQYAQYTNEILPSPTVNLDPRPEFSNPSILGEGTDWQNQIFRAAPITNHQLSISGGKENTKFYASVNYFDQEGIQINTDLRRYGIRLNLDHKYNDWIKFGNNINFSNSLETVGFNDARNGIITLSLRQTPDIPVRNSSGGFGAQESDNVSGNAIANPVFQSQIRSNQLERYKVNGNVFLEFNLGKSLTFRTDLGYDYNTTKNEAFNPTFDFGPTLRNTTNTGVKTANEAFFYLFKNYLTYNQSFGGHNLNILAGMEAQKAEFQGITGQAFNFPSNDITGFNTADVDGAVVNSFKGSSTLASYFGRINYNYDSKYLLSVSARYDGSSKFGPNNKWGLFPSASAAWVVSEEPFMEGIADAWSYFKIRAGYGTSGNQAIGDNLFRSFLQNRLTALGSAFVLGNFPNPDVAWESLISPNLGVELGFINNRIRLDVDVYRKTSKDFLSVQPLSSFLGALNSQPFLGVAPPVRNFGEMVNDGIDVTLKTQNFNKDKFTWTTDIILSAYRNEITELTNEGDAIIGLFRDEERPAELTRTIVGEPIAQFYGYVTDGLFRSQEELTAGPLQDGLSIDETSGVWLGDIRYKDLNGDGEITDADRTFIGSPHPDFTYSVTNNFKFGDFDLSIFLQGSYGNEIYNWTRVYTEGLFSFSSNQSTAVLDRYTASNPNGSLPRYVDGDVTNNTRISDRFVEDGSYLRIQSVTFGWSIPGKTFGTNSFLDQVRVYSTLQNLYTFTNYSGFDPEVGAFNQSALLNGFDFGRYPVPRTVTFGLNVQF